MPKLFRLTKGGKLNREIFQGATINTPSLLAVEDALDSLRWAESLGGLPALIVRSEGNLKAVEDWVAARDWVEFLAQDPANRSCTSICLAVADPWFRALAPEAQAAAVKRIAALVEDAGAGLDIGAHRDAPPGLRIWGGPTVETSDIATLLPWLDWAYAEMKQERNAA
jgi:phosphoserine aminotransferase